jgi:hypothetical protein
MFLYCKRARQKLNCVIVRVSNSQTPPSPDHLPFIAKVSNMRIKVSADTVNYASVIAYYNANKPADEEPLERLDRFEGGFQIQIESMKNTPIDSNLKIRQLRWSRGCLLSGYHIGFTEKQTLLLYEALVHSYGIGEGVVLLY